MNVDVRGGADRLRTAALDLAWSLWSECGQSSWHTRRHTAWHVELEPLLVLTSLMGPNDPRLLREAVDWSVCNKRFISLKQFSHVVTAEHWPFKGDIARFGATVGSFTRERWPGVTDETPIAVSLSGKSRPPDLPQPALLGLRLRAIFGVNARAEITRVMLTRPGALSVSQIAERVPFTRRQVALDLAMLSAGGLLRQHSRSRPTTYSLANPETAVALFGPLPRYAPRWGPIFRVLTGLLDAFDDLISMSLAVPGAELLRQLKHLDPSIERAGITLPRPTPDEDYVEAILRWSVATFVALADGDPTALGPDILIRPLPDGLSRP